MFYLYCIREEYVNNILNSQLSYQLFGTITQPTYKNCGFAYHLPTYVGVWGGQTMSRTKNFSWRIIPNRWENTQDSNPGKNRNSGFVIEVMFNEPIMHVDNVFNTTNFGTTCPYKYLTLSGQGIIRYALTNQIAK